MEKQIITFSANEQTLTKTGGVDCYASNTVAYIEARFDLGDNWSGYDSVRAVWFTDFVSGISTVLDSDGVCIVPYEVLTRKGGVKVNLVGSISNGEELTDRLTTCPVTAVVVKCNAKVTGANSTPITPSQFEQFVNIVKADADRAEAGATASAQSAVNANASAEEAEASAQNASESASASAISASDSARSATASAESAQNASESAQNAENAKDDAESARDKILSMRATASTLPAGSDATASYNDGLLSLGIPKGDTGATGAKGDKGDTGATPNFSIGTVSTLEPNTDATASITGTAEEPVLNLGIPKGDTGEVSYEELSSLLPRDTASGDIVTIPDGQSVIPAESLKVELEPIQDLHGYDKPWAGGAGKNKIPPKTGQAGSAQLILGDDATALSSASGVFLKSGTYTLSVNSTKTSTIYWYDVSSGANKGIGNTLAPRKVTVSEDGYYFPFLYNSSGVSSSDVSTFQLEAGSSATSYEPYSNICPISGRTEVVTQRAGVNVWDEEWEVGYLTNDGQNTPNANRIRAKNYIGCKPNTQYYFKSTSYSSWYIVCFYNASKESAGYLAPNSNNAFTTPTNAYYMRFALNDSYGTTYNNDISINYPSTDHEYHAYNGQSYTTDLGRTVYGGTLDVVSGVLTVTHAYTNLGVLNYSKSVSPQRFEATTTLPNCKAPASSSEALNGLCTEYEIYSADAFSGQDASMYMTTSGLLRIYDSSRYSLSASDFKTVMGNVQICYELATPQTYQLTPQEVRTLLGTNNIWSDGKVTLTYNADIQKWVEKKLNGNSTTLTMSRPMTAELNETETETAETE